MIETTFWPRVWRLETQLQSLPEMSLDDQAAVVQTLKDNLPAQRYLFTHRKLSEPEWLDIFRREGLFDSPPEPRGSLGAEIVEAWPCMDYLARVAETEPGEVSGLILQLDTSNWWILGDALQVIENLPDDNVGEPLIHVLRLWQKAPVQWARRDILPRVYVRAASTPNASAILKEASLRILVPFLTRPTPRYDVSFFLRSTLEHLPEDESYLLAEGIEGAIAFHATLLGAHNFLFFPTLHEIASGGFRPDDPVESLLTTWLELVRRRSKQNPREPWISRSVTLIGLGHPLPQMMGLRLLRLAADQAESDPLVNVLIERFVEQEDGLVRRETREELTDLLTSQWDKLPLTLQRTIHSRIVDLAQSQETPEKVIALAWLTTLAGYLGPEDHALTEELRTLLDEPVAVSRFSTTGGWIGPQTPLTNDQLRELPFHELLAWMHHVPGPAQGEAWGPSMEGLGRSLESVVPERLDEFLRGLGSLESVTHPSLHFHMIRGLATALHSSEQRTPEVLSAVLGYFEVVVGLARSGALIRDDAETAESGSSVIGAMCTFLEDHAEWMASVGGVSLLAKTVLEAGFGDGDPSPEQEREFGGTNMDPPTLALNSTRGKALRALLALLVPNWDNEILESSGLRSVLEEMLLDRASNEESPSVRSSFGLYLPWLLRHWPGGDGQDLLLPMERHPASWEATFVTYLMFRRPNQDFYVDLAPQYSHAVEQLSDANRLFLRSNADALSRHLVSLSLVDSPEGSQAFELLLTALRLGESDQIYQGLSSIARTSDFRDVVGQRDWPETLVRRRISASGRSQVNSVQPDEAAALFEILAAARHSLTRCGTLLLHLIQLGAVPEEEDVWGFLDEVDDPRTRLGASLLVATVRARLKTLVGIWGFNEYARLAEEYAANAPKETIELVELLGENGFYGVEAIARNLYQSDT